MSAIVPAGVSGFGSPSQHKAVLKTKNVDPNALVPGAEDFTPRAVSRAVLTETVQHPATILPAATAAVSALYLGVIGLEPAAFAVAFGSALVALGAWIFNYFVRGEPLARRHVERLLEKRRQLRLGELETLAAEWQATGHREGTQQARELGEAYRKLEAFLKERFQAGKTTALNVERLMVLAEDTYREGLGILRKALDVYRALLQSDRGKLEGEVRAWQGELEALHAREAHGADADIKAARAASLETRIAAHERRIDLHAQQTRTLQELLAESEELEAALESTYLEAADLGSADAFFARGVAVSELERAMGAARRVEERLRGMSEPNREEDEIYLTAGRQPD